MRENFLYLTTIVIILAFGACSNEEALPDTELETGRTITLTATMPDEDPNTRVELFPGAGLNIKLKWMSGDHIKLLFVQGNTNHWGAINPVVTDIVGNKANFTVQIPTTMNLELPFEMYGVYGQNNLDLDNRRILFTQQLWLHNTLTKIKDGKDVVLHFVHKFKGYDDLTIPVAVKFKHVGSLFCIHLKNTSNDALPKHTTNEVFSGALLTGVGGDGKWAYNVENREYFNFEGEPFRNLTTAGNYLRFRTKDYPETLASKKDTDMWAWYPILPNKQWPALKLQLIAGGSVTAIIKESSTNKKSIKPSAGMAYHFYAVWDGTDLIFKTKAEYDPLIPVTN